MNIKGLVPTQTVNDLRPVERAARMIKSDNAHDRDPHGQQYQGSKQEQGPMSDEQIEKAIEQLRALNVIVEHKWTVELEVDQDQKKFAVVKDNLGTVVRRIPERELWTLPAQDDPRGHLLKKAA